MVWIGLIIYWTLLVGTAIMVALNDRHVAGSLGEHLKITSGILAVLGGAVALLISYRKQHSTERDLELSTKRDERDLQLATDREHRDRFAAGVTLLGNPEPTIALAGVYALANLADDWDEGAQQCLDILCARLRLPWPKKSELPPDASPDDETSWWDDGECEIRNTIRRTIAAHLKEPDPTDKDRDNTKPGRWSPLDIDLTSARLPGIDSSRAHLSTARFEGARFTGTAQFDSATFTGITMLPAP